MEPEVYTIMQQREGAFWWHVGMQKIIISQLRQFAPHPFGNIILDAGCGTGAMFKALADYGTVYGVDQSPLAIQYAQAKNIACETKLASVTALPYAPQTFDIVICLDVLYHTAVTSPEQALAEFYRVLRPGGLLIMREPAFNLLRGHHDKIVWTKKRYRKKELIAELTVAGFSIRKASYINFFLFPLALIKRLSDNLYEPKNIIEKTFLSQPVINGILKQFLFLEAKLLQYLNFPFGLSVMCLARKK